MKLWSLNRMFKLFGFRLVVAYDPQDNSVPTTIYFVRNSTWFRRTKQT